MVFSSIEFLFFFLPFLILFYSIVPQKFKNLVMIIGSFIFYAWGEIRFIPILLALSVIDYFNGRMIEKFDSENSLRILFMILSVIINVSVLCFFKYTNFFVANVCSVFNLTPPDLNIMLPIGISFNTFQEISYIVDVYKRKTPAEKSYYNYLTFTTLFPQIVSGPIVRYTSVGNDLSVRKISYSNLNNGLRRFVRGLVKKVLIANNIGALWNSVVSGEVGEMSVLLYWMGILAYTFQIFFDFSGYSDMAIGLGKIFGFTFGENFDYPYASKSITEFWRRWHISLGSWFRDYVYIPLGGNRCSKLRNIFNILVVWGLTGLWHGASWNFVLWGLYFALLLIVEKLFLGKFLEKLPKLIRHLYTMFFVVLGWILFYFEEMSDVVLYFKGMFGFTGVPLYNDNFGYLFVTNTAVFVAAIILSTPIIGGFIDRIDKSKSRILGIVSSLFYAALFVLCVGYLVNSTYNPFLYFRF